MKKNCEIVLKGLTKKWRKKAIKTAKSVGYVWSDGDRFNDGFMALCFHNGLHEMFYYEGRSSMDYEVLHLPEDWDKFLECIGAEKERRLGEYKVSCSHAEPFTGYLEFNPSANWQQEAESYRESFENCKKELDKAREEIGHYQKMEIVFRERINDMMLGR